MGTATVTRLPFDERIPESGLRRIGSTLPATAAAEEDLSETTHLSDLVAELARLGHGESVPLLERPLSKADGLSPSEAFVASLVATNMQLNVEMILDMSPMPEDQTLQFLARLLTNRIIKIAS